MFVVKIGNTRFKHSMASGNLSEALVEIKAAKAAADVLHKKLLAACVMSGKAFEASQDELLHDPRSVLYSVIRANRKIKEKRRGSLEECFEVAGSLSFSKRIIEPVLASAWEKHSGGVRVTCNFGLRYRTAQDLVVRAMECHFVPRKFQFTFSGIQKAIGFAKKCLGEGLIYCATLDIENHFGSFELEKLVPKLPVPKDVVENVVLGRHIAVVADKRKSPGSACLPTHTLQLLARRGIPTGSACSPIVAAYCMAALSWAPTEGLAIINYADNFLLLASSEEKLQKAIEDLTKAVGDLPGGHFNLKLCEVPSVYEGFQFLGHRLIEVAGSIITSATEANEGHFWAKITRIDEKMCQLSGTNQAVMLFNGTKLAASFYKFYSDWLAAFKECDEIPEWKQFCEGELEKYRTALGITPAQVRAAVDETMGYKPKDYVLGH